MNVDTWYGDLPEPTAKHDRISEHKMMWWKKAPGSQVTGVCCPECGFLLID